jgi:hypothetical protein
MHNISRGSETEYVQPNSPHFRPQFFSEEQLKVVTRVVEILLGKVDAGALSQTVQWLDLYLYSAAGIRDAALQLDLLHRALAVAYYGENAARELETADPQNVVRSGLRALQRDSVERYGREFLILHEEQQAQLIVTIRTAPPDSHCASFLKHCALKQFAVITPLPPGSKSSTTKATGITPPAPVVNKSHKK